MTRIGRFLIPLIALSAAAGWESTPARAETAEETTKEMPRLKERVERLERELGTAEESGLGHARHPIHSLFGAKISGGLTTILQGTLRNEERFGGRSGEGEMSADLFLEAPVGEKGSFLLRLDVQQGAGLTRLPPLFTNPDGNLTGPNNDVETFSNPDQVNLNEARYEHLFANDAIKVTFGQIDLTSYFDENRLANKETFQYLAQHFNNNITIDWGGSVNFFGPGLVLSYEPHDFFFLRASFFEGDGDYTDMFEDPFIAGQVGFTIRPAGQEGNYRLYAWERSTPHCRSASDPALFSDCALIPDPDRVVRAKRNVGTGISLDQRLSDRVGAWARWGNQNENVAQFDTAASAGLVLLPARARPDEVGLAYGIVFPGGPYEEAIGKDRAEQYAEIYYKRVIIGDGSASGFHLTPDLQIIRNPGGDGAVDTVLIWGLRAQVHF